jgi:hypothetical protein
MRSGTILEMPISDDDSAMVRPNMDRKTKVRKWMACIDNETPIAVAVDMVSERIFTMTKEGLFTTWDLMTFDVIFSRDFYMIAHNIIAFKLQNKVLLVFEHEIKVIDSTLEGSYEELPDFHLKLNQISDAKLNSNEKLLGVALTQNSTPQVAIYSTDLGGFTI